MPSVERDTSLWDDWRSHVAAGGDLLLVRAAVEAARPRVSKLRDPFLAIGRDDPGARAQEHVLWEDERCFVVVDRFGAPLKALVVPKVEALFPLDLGRDFIARLDDVAHAVMGAFSTLTGTRARAWINPPAALTVRQLHIHVLGAAPQAPTHDLYAQVQQALTRTLGAPTAIPPEEPKTPGQRFA